MKPSVYCHLISLRMTALFLSCLTFCAIPVSGWGQANPKPRTSEFTRGTVDGCGITYTLSYSPLVFQMSSQNSQPSCSVNTTGDVDGDGFWDQAEAELIWAFAPWIEFDEKEDFIDGMVFVYQATPDRTWWSGRGLHLLKVKLLFLFRDDVSHTGDSEGITMKLVSSDEDARTWRIYDVTGYNAGHIDVRENELSTFCVDPGMVATPYLDLEAFYCGSRGEEFFYDPMVHIGASNSLVDSGMIHPKIFISDGKHGLYPKLWQCNEQIHEFQYEDCGLDNEENQRGIMIPAIPLVFSEERLYGDNADIYSWTQPLSEYLQTGNVSGLNSLIGQGNLGEIGRYLIPQIPWFLNENVQNRCFCGGHRPNCHSDMFYNTDSCSNCVSADGTGDGYSCGAGISRKMGSAQLPYKTTTCSLVDSDQDGVSDEFDCEPYNPQLKGDWDRDGLCDEPVEDEAVCLAECDHFKIFDKSKCEFRCKTVDPCVFKDPGSSICRALQESVLPYRKLSVLTLQEKWQFNNCQKIYGNTFFHHRRMNGAYEYVVANHLCDNYEWSWIDADVVQREVTASREVIGPAGQKIPIPMVCSGQFLDTSLYWAGGWFSYSNNEVSAVNLDFPSSLMACGIDPYEGNPSDCDVSLDGEADSIPWKAMEPLVNSFGGWDLTDPIRYSYPNVEWAGDLFRHKKLIFSPEKPSIGGSGQKQFSAIWQSQTAFSGQNTLVRFSHPSRGKIQQEEYQLLPLERSASPWMTL